VSADDDDLDPLAHVSADDDDLDPLAH